MNKTLLVICLLTACASGAFGYPDDYSPFAPGTTPKAFPMRKLKNIAPESDRTIYIFAEGPKSSPRILISDDPNDTTKCTLSIIAPNGRKIIPDATMHEDYLYNTSAYSGLLNDNTVPDYVIEVGSTGCGLAAHICSVIFLLSTGETYSTIETVSYWTSEADFVDLNKDGRAEFIHTSFIEGEVGKDKKYHNYWVFNLLRFNGTQMVSANDIDRRFPCWVWYKFKPNHENTDQLTAEQRMRCWRKEWSNPWPEGFQIPLMLIFEKEQGRIPRR
jgi:hypothetical protein